MATSLNILGTKAGSHKNFLIIKTFKMEKKIVAQIKLSIYALCPRPHMHALQYDFVCAQKYNTSPHETYHVFFQNMHA